MKVYKVELDMTYVLGRLKKFNLKQYNNQFPIIFVDANDPDEACYLAIYQLAAILIQQEPSYENAVFIKDVIYDINILKVRCPE